MGETGRTLLTTRSEITRSFKKFEFDQRTGGIFVGNSYDAVEYNNYYSYMIALFNEKYSQAPDVHDRIADYLDLGYVPYLLPPTFLTERNCSYVKKLREVAKSFSYGGEKLKLIHEKPIRVDGNIAGQEETDIWVSRLQLAKFMGCKPEDVTMFNMYKLILKGGN